MRAFAIVVAAMWLLVGAERSAAATFDFTFNNLNEGGGVVKGIVSGLADAGVSSATSLRVTSNTLGFGLGEYVGSPYVNSFEVAGNQVVSYNFLSFGVTNAAPSVQCCSLVMSNYGLFPIGVSNAGLSNSPDTVHSSADTALTFTPAPIPLPASMLLLAGAVVALAGLRLRSGGVSRA